MIFRNKLKKLIIAICLLFIGIIAGIFIGKSKGFPFVKRLDKWSIGIYIGRNPFNFSTNNKIKNPVLTAESITDIDAEFVADPFMIKEGNEWYMFFEVMNAYTKQGDIGVATSLDGINWEYKQIVLDEKFHLSYPYVIKWKDEYYMIPESHEDNSVRLYKATNFPTTWKLIKVILHGYYNDSSLIFYNKIWWIFTSDRNDTLRLYYSKDLLGPWIEHIKSPIIKGNANVARPGGKIILYENILVRYTQDDYPTYGNQVQAIKIVELTTTDYKEDMKDKIPILKATGVGWNKDGMHHIDPHRISNDKWIACVDGFHKVLVFGFKY